MLCGMVLVAEGGYDVCLGRRGRSRSVWFHILEVFAPEILKVRFDGYKSKSESVQEYIARTQYRAGSRPQAWQTLLRRGRPRLIDDQEAFCSTRQDPEGVGQGLSYLRCHLRPTAKGWHDQVEAIR